jgi:hypothetical protein
MEGFSPAVLINNCQDNPAQQIGDWLCKKVLNYSEPERLRLRLAATQSLSPLRSDAL